MSVHTNCAVSVCTIKDIYKKTVDWDELYDSLQSTEVSYDNQGLYFSLSGRTDIAPFWVQTNAEVSTARR